MTNVNHFRRFMILWLVSSVIATPLVVVLVGPIIPPGNGSVQASGQGQDNTVLIGMATPVFMLVLVYMIYALINFRAQPDSVLEGPAVRGDSRVQIWWIVITSTLVLALAVYGSVELLNDGAGAGQGP